MHMVTITEHIVKTRKRMQDKKTITKHEHQTIK